MTDAVTDNQDRNRYELVVDGHTAFTEYRLEGNRITFPHTLVPKELEGRGVGSRLVNAALDDAEARGLEIVPTCSFVAALHQRRQEKRQS